MKIVSLKLRRSSLYYGVTAVVFITLLFSLWGLEYLDEQQLAALPNQPADPPSGKVSIVIKVTERLLEVHSDEHLYKSFRVAVGKSETPTPVGEWTVVWKDYNWGTGFGSRWMGLNVPWGIYGIHGTDKPWSIGKFASHGCIRMRNKDVEELFEWVPIGTEVKIVGKNTRIQRVLRYKSSGADVVQLQLKLKEDGYLITRADGFFGKITEEAVRVYQSDRGLEPTGIVDKRTREKLGL